MPGLSLIDIMADKKIYTDSGIEIKPVYAEPGTKDDKLKPELPGNFLLPVAFSLICTAANYGPCGNMPVFPLQKKAINDIIIYYHRV